MKAPLISLSLAMAPALLAFGLKLQVVYARYPIVPVRLGYVQNQKQEKHFKREEQFPDGKQTSWAGQIFGNSIEGKVTQFTFDAPYSQVWVAAKRAARAFGNVGKRSVQVHESSGIISHKSLDGSQDREPRGSTQSQLISATWQDEFKTEVTQIAPQQTKVRIARKVIELRSGTQGTQWANAVSNDKIERWLLSRIEDEIKSQSTSNTVNSGDPDVGYFTNADVIDLLNERVSESVIFTKIRTSRCKFDVSTQGIIALKQAGASESLIQFMIEGDAGRRR